MNVCGLDHAEALPPELRAVGKKWAIAIFACMAISPVGMLIGLMVCLAGGSPKTGLGLMFGSQVLSRICMRGCALRGMIVTRYPIPRSYWRSILYSCCLYAAIAYFVWSM
jgi:hypothetical protein